MAGELLSFGIQKLWDLLTNEYNKFQGFEDQVVELKSVLNLLSSFLQDAIAKKHASAVVKNCIEEVKEIILDAEDIIETFLMKEGFKRANGIKKYIRRLACNCSYSRKIASDIESLSKRISKVISDMRNFGVQQMIIEVGRYSHPIQEKQREMRQTFSMDSERDFVGLEENVNNIVGYLLEEDNIQVVSITGMGGLGKTTLARHVFNHEKIEKEFNDFAWVCVSQDFKRKDVWQNILRDLKPKKEDNIILQMSEHTLQKELFRKLEKSKTLIVLDDLWKEEDWILIRHVFPAIKGCKIILTSRNDNVVKHGNTPFFNFKLKCLTNEESWLLFYKTAFRIKNSSELDDEMVNMAKQMIKHCWGLPLAIKVLGSLLANKYTLDEWKRLGENIKSHIIGGSSFNESNNSSVYHILSLSFEELPNYLKNCFLYLAHFPEDYEINVETLSYYWSAEGIPKPNYYDEASIRDIADVYIEELVSKHMVIAKRDIFTSRFETLHLHDMMRDICLDKAKEENFLQIVGNPSPTTRSKSLGPPRRFASQNPTKLDIESEINNQKLRSLLIVNSNISGKNIEKWKISGLTFKRLELLRLLDLNRAKFEGGKLPDRIGKLIHLRYLSLKGVEVSHLPSSLRNLKLLIYLNIAEFKGIFKSNVLMEMRELRYLALPMSISVRHRKKLNMCNLVNLETLINFSTEVCDLEDLHGMTRLRTLEIHLSVGENIETLYTYVGGLRFLESLCIHEHQSQRTRMQEDIILFDFTNLKKLELHGIHMSKLLNEKHFSSNLTTISFQQSILEEDPMPILEKFLQLKAVYLSVRYFYVKRMVCSRSGFPQLRKLVMWGLEDLEEWIIEEGTMPLLHSLTMMRCDNLKELPDGLRFIYSLKNLKIDWKWNKRASEGGEEYCIVQHIPSIEFFGLRME